MFHSSRLPALLVFAFSLSLTLCTGRAAVGDPLPAGSVAGDFNADGRLDVLVQPADATHPGRIVLQDGTGALSVQVQVIDASFLGLDWVQSDSVAYTGDFNGDGRSDVLLQSKTKDGVQAILLSDPTSQLNQIAQTIPANYMGLDWSAAAHRIVVGDFNGDGHSDVLLQSVGPNDVNLIVNANSQGQLNTTGQGWMDGYLGREWSANDVQIYTGDFNGDGKTDLLLQTRNGQETNGQSAYALILADDKGQFTRVAQTWNADDLGADWSPATHSLSVRDVNGDGIADIVLTASNGKGRNYLLLGTPSGTFGKPAVSWKGNESAEDALRQDEHSAGSISISSSPTSTTPKTMSLATASTTATTLNTNFATASLAGTLAGTPGVNGGAATYTIPITVPPGRAGMQPSVSLTYSSRGGNGELGMGWSVSAGSQISRCPETVAQDNQSLGVTYTSTDRLCLDGQRLIPVSGTYGTGGSVYRTELESFVRVTEYGDISSATSYFKVESKDNQVSYYGYNSSRSGANSVFVAAGETQPLSWALERVEDRTPNQNSTLYTYAAFGNGEYHLSEIQYTGSDSTPGNRYVAFDYEPRTDVGTSFLAGGLTNQTRILQDVRTSDDGSTQVLQYNIQYGTSAATGRTLLAGVQECGYRKIQGSQTPVCLPATTFSWNAPTLMFNDPVTTGTNNDASSGVTHTVDMAAPPQPSLSSPGDFDGDGRKELLWYRSGVGEKVLFLNADNSIRQSVDVSSLFSDVILHHGDITGDGATDLLGNDNGELGYSSWDGTGFSAPQSLGIPYFYNTYAVDVDGDGKIDVAQNETNPADSSGFIFKVYLNTSSNGTVSFNATPVATYTTQSAQYVAPAGDLDGNGLPDFFVTNFNPSGGGVKTQGVLFTTGKRGSPKLTYVPYANMNLDAQAHIGGVDSKTIYQNGYFMDINGDGLPDFVFDCSNGDWCYQLNEGGNGSETTFGNRVDTNVVDSRSEMGITAALTADIDNDGIEEILYPDQMLDMFCSRDKVNIEGTISTEDECYDSPGTNHLPATQNFSLYNYAELKFEPQADGSGGVSYVPTVRSGTATHLIGQANLATAGDLGGNGVMDLISPFTKWYENGEFLQADGNFLSCPEAPYPCGTGVSQNTSESATDKNAAPDMMLSATDGFGVSQYWDYYPLSSSVAFNGNSLYYAPAIGSSERTQDALDGYFYFTSSMYVVGEYRESNGAGSGANSHDFHYARAIYQSKGRGFQGFKVVVDENNATGIRNVQVYHQHFPLSGQLEESWTNLFSAGLDLSNPQSGNNFISDTQYTEECQRGSQAPAIAGNTFTCKTDLGVDAPTYLPLLDKTVETQRDARTGDVLSTTTTGLTYDMFGNITGKVTTVDSSSDPSGTSYASTVNNVITNNESIWWLSRLDKATDSPSILYSSDDPGSTMPATVTAYEYDQASRAPTKKTVMPDDAAHTVETDYGYDGYGNTTSVTVSGGDATAGTAVAARTTTSTYTADGYFVSSVTDPMGLVTHTTPDDATGNPLSVTAPDGVVTRYSYDPLGRKISTQVSSATQTLPAETVTYATTATGCPSGTVFAVSTARTGYPGHTVCKDLLGRTIRSISDGFNASTPTYVDTTYDTRSRVTSQSVPHFSTVTTPPTDTFTYDTSIDPLGRVTHTHEAKGVDSDYAYHDLTTTVSVTQTNDNRTRTTTETHNALGKLVSTVDTNGSDTEFRYDAHGNPVYIKDTAGNVISTAYNVLDQKTSVDDPDQGHSSFLYDVLGELKTQTDAKGQTITQGYDPDGRMTSRSRSDGVSASWVYDTCANGKGKLCSLSQSDGYAEADTYDDLGRVTNLDNTINNTDYNTSTSYDTDGRVLQVSYPDLSGVNAVPTANAGPDQSVALPVSGSVSVTLDGSGSTNPSDKLGALRYAWSQTGGPTVTLSGAATATPSFSTTAAGTYTFQLTVNNDVAEATDMVTITVTPGKVTGLSVTSTDAHDLPQFSTTGSYTLAWTAAINGATSFRLLQSTDGGSSYADQGTATSPDTLSGMGSSTQNITYTYEVIGCAGSLCGPPSDPVSITVEWPPGAPASINLPSVSNADGSFTVSWGAAAGLVSSYKVELGTYDSEMQRYDWLSGHCGGSGSARSCGFAAGAVGDGAYYAHVYACNDHACGAATQATNEIQVQTIATPTLSSSAPTTQTGDYTLSWNTVTYAATYELQRASQSNYGDATTVQNTSATSYSVTGAGNGTYYYRVRGCSSSTTCGGWGTLTELVTLPPAAPTAVTVAPLSDPAPKYTQHTTNSGSYTLSWTASASGLVTAYNVYESVNNGSYTLIQTVSPNQTSVSITGRGSATQDIQYTYQVEACNQDACTSAYSDPVTVTLPPAAPGTPSISPGVSSNGNFTLSWTVPVGGVVTSYDVLESTDGATFAVVGTNITNTSWSPASAKGNGAYYYEVEACNLYNCSTPSSSNEVYVYLPPGAPNGVSVSPGTSTNGSYTVSWGAPSSGEYTYFQLYESVNGGGYTLIVDNLSTSTLSYPLSGKGSHSSNDTYSYEVAACNHVASSCTLSGAASVVVTYPPSGAPGSASLSPNPSTNGSATLNWGSGTSGVVSYYRIYVSTDNSNFSWTSDASGSATSWETPTLGNGTYYYKVRACNGTYNCSGSYSPVASVLVTLPPGEPSSITLPSSSNWDGSFIVSWGAASGQLTDYHVDIGEWDGELKVYHWVDGHCSTSGATSCTFSSSKVSNGTYYARVYACNQTACGSARISSNTIQVSRLTAPAAPSLSGPSTASGSATITWSAPSTATSYELFRQTYNGAWSAWSEVYSGSGRSYSDSYGARVTQVSYYALACNQAGCSGHSNTLNITNSLTGTGGGGCKTCSPTLQTQRTADAAASASGPAQPSVAPSSPTPSVNSNNSVPAPDAGVRSNLMTAATTTTPTPNVAQFRVAYAYTGTGYLSQIVNARDTGEVYWQVDSTVAAPLSPRGQVQAETFGNGVQSARTYDPASGYLTAIQSGLNGGDDVQNLSYVWEPLGNLSNRNDGNRGLNESFSYDTLNRLTGGVLTNGTGTSTTSYAYDAIGNLTSKSDTGTYTYGNGAGPHAVTGVTGALPGTYQYDADGNMTDRNGTAITWNADSLPTCIDTGNTGCTDTSSTANWSQFSYAPDKHRYDQTAKVNGTTETTVYIGNMEIVTRNGRTDYRQRLSAYGRDVGEFIVSTDSSNDQMTYILTDHLGSVDVVTDSSGAPISGTGWSFEAFGKRRDAGTWSGAPATGVVSADRDVTHRGFTNQEMLDNVALIHMNGRVYDPNLGRFLSVDPVFEFPTNTQSLNPYSYVLNNPLSLTDPTGYTACSSVSVKDGHDAGMCSVTDKGGNKAWVAYDVHKNGDVSFNTQDLKAAMPVIQNMASNSAQNKPTDTASIGSPEQISRNTGDNSSGSTSSATQVTGTGAGTSSDQKVIAPSHDVRRTKAGDAWALQDAPLLPNPISPNELTLVSTAQSGLWYVTDNCQNAGCDISSHDYLGTPEDVLHSHQFSLQPLLSVRLSETFQRELPGSGDWKVVAAYGVVNYFRAPSGIVRAVEYYGGAYHVSTVTPGAPDAYGQSQWKPNQPTNPLSPAQQGVIWRAQHDESQDFNRLWQQGLPH